MAKTSKPNIYLNEKAKKKNYFYEFEYKDSFGRRQRQKSRGFATIKEAEQAMIIRKHELMEGKVTDASKITVAEYMDEWLKNRRNLGERTREIYECIIRVHIKPFFQGMLLSKLLPINIEQFVTHLEKDKNLSDATVYRIFSCFNGALNHAVHKLDLLAKNPTKKIEKPKVNRKKMHILDTTSMRRFLADAKAHGSRLYIAFFLAAMCGMRQSEILGLQWNHITFHNDGTATIHIQQTLSKDGKRLLPIAKTKTSIRSIDVSEAIVKELKHHKDLLEKERLLMGASYEGDQPIMVVSTSRGTPVGNRQVQKIWNSYRKKFGYIPKEMTFHDLRHSFASLMLDETSPKVIQEALGHSTITTTMNLYAHLLPNMGKDASKALSKKILDL